MRRRPSGTRDGSPVWDAATMNVGLRIRTYVHLRQRTYSGYLNPPCGVNLPSLSLYLSGRAYLQRGETAKVYRAAFSRQFSKCPRGVAGLAVMFQRRTTSPEGNEHIQGVPKTIPLISKLSQSQKVSRRSSSQCGFRERFMTQS